MAFLLSYKVILGNRLIHVNRGRIKTAACAPSAGIGQTGLFYFTLRQIIFRMTIHSPYSLSLPGFLSKNGGDLYLHTGSGSFLEKKEYITWCSF